MTFGEAPAHRIAFEDVDIEKARREMLVSLFMDRVSGALMLHPAFGGEHTRAEDAARRIAQVTLNGEAVKLKEELLETHAAINEVAEELRGAVVEKLKQNGLASNFAEEISPELRLLSGASHGIGHALNEMNSDS